MSAESRVAELIEQLEEHNYRYHVLAEPVISDREYDLLLEELQRLEESDSELKRADSPTQRVGGQPTQEFPAVRHATPMLSLDNSYSPGGRPRLRQTGARGASRGECRVRRRAEDRRRRPEPGV